MVSSGTIFHLKPATNSWITCFKPVIPWELVHCCPFITPFPTCIMKTSHFCKNVPSFVYYGTCTRTPELRGLVKHAIPAVSTARTEVPQ